LVTLLKVQAQGVRSGILGEHRRLVERSGPVLATTPPEVVACTGRSEVRHATTTQEEVAATPLAVDGRGRHATTSAAPLSAGCGSRGPPIGAISECRFVFYSQRDALFSRLPQPNLSDPEIKTGIGLPPITNYSPAPDTKNGVRGHRELRTTWSQQALAP
jgi:hypothetical protein